MGAGYLQKRGDQFYLEDKTLKKRDKPTEGGGGGV